MSDNKKKTSYSSLTGFKRAVPIILFAVSVFVALCFITQEMGSLGPAISGILLGLFSWGAYAIPALLALHAIFYPSDVGEKRVLSRIIFSAIAVISLSAFAHTVSFWQNKEAVFNIGEFYRNGQSAIGGGVVGSTVGFGIVKLLGSIGLIIVAATVLAIYVSYFFSRGQKGLSKVFYSILKGIVFFCAAVEKGIKNLFSKAKRSKAEKKQREAEEKGRELMDDEFFDVDNGISSLEISELGIVETRDPASVEEHATLRDKVHHKSDATPEEAAEMDRRARERAAASAIYYEDMTAGTGVISGDYGLSESEIREGTEERMPERPVYEIKEATEPADVSTAELLASVKEPSADEIFTADFDPYELAMSERLANKPSSRSLLDDKPSVTEEIHELTEEDAERARRNAEFETRNAEFERRKAMLTASHKPDEEPVEAHKDEEPVADEPMKTVEYKVEEPVPAATVASEEDGRDSVSVVIEKPAAAPAREETPVYTPENPYVYSFGTAPSEEKREDARSEAPAAGYTAPAPSYTAPATGYSAPTSGYTATVAPAPSEAPASPAASAEPAVESGARATYRRAAEFAANTVVEDKPEPAYTEPRVESTTSYTVPKPQPAPSYTAPAAEPKPAYNETVYSAPATEPAPTHSAPAHTAPAVEATPAYTAPVAEPAPTYSTPAYTAPAAEASYGAPSAAYSEPVASYTEPVDDYTEPEAAPAPTYTEPRKPVYQLEETENVYTPTFEDESAKGATIGGEYTTTDGEDTESAADFKDYATETSDGGLVFEFDMGPKDEPKEPETKVLVTETTHYGEEDEPDAEDIPATDEPEEGEDDEVVAEVVEEDAEDEEIPPEKRNPFVSEMRDMFPALREESESESCEATEPEEGEEDDDVPPFDEPTAFVAPAPAPAPVKAEKPKPKPNYKNYKKPPLELMGLDVVHDTDEISQEIRDNTNIIIETLASFNVVASIKGVDRGPRITRYEVVPAKGVKVNQITNLLDNITMNLAAEGIRMEAPIPGKSAIGFEIPNKNPANVCLRELLECEEFINAKSNTFVCIGKDVAGNPVFGDIGKFPHALVAGATGMGKSVCINSIMISLLYKARPDQVKFIMIDPKKVEFRMYSGIPHLLIPVITDAKQAAGALMWAVDEMERRYDVIEKLNIRNIEAYNEKQAQDPSIGEHMPKIVIVIDELNDLMMQVRDPVEDLIMRIAQKARAAGIHLIIGTQRPDVKVITGTIKDINTRISCKVTSVVDSRTILEMAGAEKLLNRGDMLFKPVDKTKPIRVQGAYVSDNEVEAIMDFLKSQSEGAQYDDEIFAEINKAAQKCGNKKGGGGAADDGDDDGDTVGYYNDQKFLDAVELAIRSGKISTSLLQRKMSIGYGKAAKYIDAMEEIGVVSEANGQKPRDVLITMDQWYDKLSRVDLG